MRPKETMAVTTPEVPDEEPEKAGPLEQMLSAVFAETGPAGAKLQAEAVHAARAGGVRLVGPNCFGVQNADLPLNASIAAGPPRGGGGVSIVTQSGSYGMAVHALGQDEGLRVAKVFAAGNKTRDDQPSHIVQGGPESNAQADLSHAALHGIRKNAVDSNRAEHQCEQTKDRQQLHVEAMLRQGLTDKVFEGHDIVYRYVFVHVVDGARHRGGDSLRRSVRADGKEKRVRTPGTLRRTGRLCNRIVE